MGSEIFRFVTVRPPHEVASVQAAAAATIELGITATEFADSLRALRATGSRARMVEAAAAFVASAGFVGSASKIDAPYLQFMAALRALPEQGFPAAAGQAFTQAFNTTPAALVQTGAFGAFYAGVSDSIVAATIDSTVAARVRALLVEAARALGLIRRMASGASVTRGAYASAPLVLPAGIFPLPAVAESGDVRGQLAAAAGARRATATARGRRVAELTATLGAHRAAVGELLDTLERVGPAPAGGSTAANGARGNSNGRARGGFALAESTAEQLSGATRDVLRSAGLDGGPIDVVTSVAVLERRAAGIAQKLYAGTGSGGDTSTQLARVGNLIVPRPAGTAELAPANSLAPATRTPGRCPAEPATSIPADGVTVPTGHGEAKVLGIADLMVVEQDLLRYELGEVAHIENVLKAETRSRTFKRSHTTEQTVTTETETAEEKSQDLSSAERFELQTESQSVINDTASRSAGLTIHASYGPTVDATSNFNYASSSSRQQSAGASASYAREVTTKAANRVTTRTLTRRSVHTVDVIEETSQHTFDNKSGSNDITGVYRYVDKVYQAQVVNYGKRLMLEFIVPEPAAFLRHAMTASPLDGVSAVEPEPPGYCDGTTFTPLKAEDITRDNYLFWASKYGAGDVAPPPPSVILASGSKKSPSELALLGDRKVSSELMDVAITDGYLTQSAVVNLYGETQAGLHQIVYQVQDQQRTYIEPVDDGSPFTLKLQPTPVLTVTLNSLGFHNYEVLVTVFCTLSPEKFQAWQLKTFGSIMNAYLDEKSRYDQAVAEARLQARDTTLGGTNPLRNREMEQVELKKGCISLLTGQRYDLFDAVGRNIAPYGYPEIDFPEAGAEGPYVQAFEQSFEWNNLTYVFYPYFWGSKQEWPTLARLTDDDPLFARFLSAGAARVQVPVRLGFEARVLTYLATGELWGGDGTLVSSDGDTPDQLHLSIVDELRSQYGDNTVRGPGTITVTNGSANVTGSGTAFTADDEYRRIRFGGKTYVIRTVVDAQNVKLAAAFTGDSASGIGYSLGGRLVGEPWEIKLPTALVKLDSSLVFG